jgi:hypothetical protein
VPPGPHIKPGKQGMVAEQACDSTELHPEVFEHWRPSQHCEVLVHAAPPCRHATHCPPSQMSPWQQSADELQAPVVAQHLLASH